MDSIIPLTKELVFIGGGHAHALVLRKWGMKPVPGVRLTLVNPGPTAPYSGMLPGHIAGHYTRDDLMIDLVRLARFANARLVVGAATHVDRSAKTVHVPGRPPIPYDVLSIDIGVTSAMPDLPGFAAHAVAAKPLDSFATQWDAFVAKVAAGTAQPAVAVIGGGVAGVELAMAMRHRLRSTGAQGISVSIVDAGAALQGVSPSVRARLHRQLDRDGIALHAHAQVAEVTALGLRFADGQPPLEASFVTGAAGARPHGWLSEIGLDHVDGYPVVDHTLRSVTDPAIFLSGDCAHMGFAPRPKAGVFAVRQAPTLDWNLRADLIGQQRKRYRPQRSFLKLISLGDTRAVADWRGFGPSGAGLWRWKDRIDRRFMAQFAELPPMPAPRAPANAAKGVAQRMGQQPPCGGCGAKLGPAPLRDMVSALPRTARDDVLAGSGDDAAVLRMGAVTQVLSTDHLRGFTLDPATQTRITAIHALGDVWAMGAAPQGVLASIILPRQSERMQAASLREIMATAAEVFGAEGAEIVGGHSSEGSELTIGFTVTGLLPDRVVPKAIPHDGLSLILTRPLGAGTLLAAEMQGRARGEDLLNALEQMGQSQGNAAAVLAPDALAMTDVTGFGLAGHLWEMLAPSGLCATLHRDALPFYPGAETLAQQGLRASLFPANRAALAGVLEFAETDATAALLCDPQTAGGLLAAVPSTRAASLLQALHGAGAPHAAIIGDVRAPGKGAAAQALSITLED